VSGNAPENAKNLGEHKMMIRHLSEKNHAIGFRLYLPEEEEAEYSEFSCRFETFGLEDNIEEKSLGVDAIDALVNAMMRLDIFLKASKECKSGAIRWVGGVASDDFGLPWEFAKSR
jgi:hypothetical protein